MAKSYLYYLVGAFGDPIAENPTRVMFEAAFRKLKLQWMYLNINVRGGDLRDAVKGLRAMNFSGINLTIPHKVQVLKYLDSVSKDAALMGAVNTVRRDGVKLIGENTDGKGFITALTGDAGVDPKDRHVVLLGAGGAARAISVELALAGSKEIIVVNRTEKRGRELTALLNKKTPASAAYEKWDNTFRVPDGTDILVNATSIGLFPDVEARPDIDYESLVKYMTVCDVIPNPPRTPFLNEAEKRGAQTIDGLGMLVYQAAIAFKMWTGEEAPVEEMKRAINAEFGL
ncbi:MAG: shikimate dehydrogenase [Spirochaetes bacterium]|nr:shikimate dehydrogenase [Spirochaetota bacterium]